MFTNTPSAPPEILKEMYREFIITTEDYKHAMLRSQGMPESMMVPEGEPGPEEVRQREIDLQVAETRAVTQGAEALTWEQRLRLWAQRQRLLQLLHRSEPRRVAVGRPPSARSSDKLNIY